MQPTSSDEVVSVDLQTRLRCTGAQESLSMVAWRRHAAHLPKVALGVGLARTNNLRQVVVDVNVAKLADLAGVLKDASLLICLQVG